MGSGMEGDIREACGVMMRGGLILYPSDTLWGIGCDATNAGAVERVFALKGREAGKALVVLLGSSAMLGRYVEEVPEVAYELIEAAVRPLTIIYASGRNVASNVKAGDGSIGIRVTGEAFSQGLCKRFGRPVVSTSANKSGEQTPGHYGEISRAIREGVDYIVGYGQGERRRGVPSSIIRLGTGGEVEIIRR